MKIVGQIKINDTWIDQDKVPAAVVKDKIYSAISAGMSLLGYEAKNTQEKTT